LTSGDSSKTLEDFSSIEVKISPFLQQDNFSCVPCCIKMVIDYFASIHSNIVTYELQEIANCIETTELGTCNNSNLDNINKLLEKSIPSLEFIRDNSYPSWDSIIDDLNNGKPVILWIECRDKANRYFGHSVVVTGYYNGNVIYIDPIFGEQKEHIGSFFQKWESFDRFAIRVKIGERKVRRLTEFIENEGVIDE